MLAVKLMALFVIIHTVHCQPLEATSLKNVLATSKLKSTLADAASKADFSGKRFSRHVGGGGIFGGVGVFGGGGAGFPTPLYGLSHPLAVVSSVPVITTVPVVTAIPSYPVYGGYGAGYGGGFGGFGAGFRIAKIKVKGFGFGGGFLG